MTKNYPIDKSGTVFDTSVHNLLEADAQPQLSPSDNFCKARENNKNTPELIARFEATLTGAEEEETIIAPTPVETLEDKIEATNKLKPQARIEKIAELRGLNIVDVSKVCATLQKGTASISLNINQPAARIVQALKSMGM